MKNPILLDIPSRIETPRLVLRLPRPGEGAQINAAIVETQAGLQAYMPWTHPMPSVDDSEVYARLSTAKFITREELQLAMYDRVTGEYVGGSGFHRINWKIPRLEIGYWIRKSREGQGLVTESTNALTRFAFDYLGAKRVEIRCDLRNDRSEAVPKRLGFVREAVMTNDSMTANGLGDTVLFARTSLEGLPPLEVKW
jgi:RimJ/RimL family protein N-acetyltransferase